MLSGLRRIWQELDQMEAKLRGLGKNTDDSPTVASAVAGIVTARLGLITTVLSSVAALAMVVAVLFAAFQIQLATHSVILGTQQLLEAKRPKLTYEFRIRLSKLDPEKNLFALRILNQS